MWLFLSVPPRKEPIEVPKAKAPMAASPRLVCRLPPKLAVELRAETSQVLKRSCPLPRPNISQEESKAIKELRKDNSSAILTACKGVPMVVMHKQDYLNKAQELLADTDSYKPFPNDPTSRLNINWYKPPGTSKPMVD